MGQQRWLDASNPAAQDHIIAMTKEVLRARGIIGSTLAFFWNGYSTATMGFETFSEIVFQFTVTPKLVSEGLLFSLVVGLIGTLLPALRAARLPVIDALKAV